MKELKKNFFFVGVLFVMDLFTSCINHSRVATTTNMYDTSLYYRITSDSLKKVQMYEYFISKIDGNYNMMKYYWEDNKLNSVGFFYKGKKDGTWVGYYPNGTISFKISYVNGLENGKFVYYTEKGILLKIQNYSFGKEISIDYYDSAGNFVKEDTL